MEVLGYLIVMTLVGLGENIAHGLIGAKDAKIRKSINGLIKEVSSKLEKVGIDMANTNDLINQIQSVRSQLSPNAREYIALLRHEAKARKRYSDQQQKQRDYTNKINTAQTVLNNNPQSMSLGEDIANAITGKDLESDVNNSGLSDALINGGVTTPVSKTPKPGGRITWNNMPPKII